MQAIYRIYDTIEKRHRDDMFVNTKWLLYEVVNWYELKSVFHQDRYMVERSTWLYDKNKVLIYENDVTEYVKKKWFQIYHVTRFPINVVTFTEWVFELSYKDEHSIYIWNESVKVIWHAIRDSHLLEQ